MTKIRWVVEAVHGILKQKYRFFDHRIDNNLLPKVGILFKIVSYLNNVYGKRLKSDEGMFDEVVERMLKMKDQPNTLCDEVQANNWNRVRRPWRQVTSDSLLDFPHLSERNLKIFFNGTYQLGQSVSYLADVVNDQDLISQNFWYHCDRSSILKLKVQSRHINATEWRCYIDYAAGADCLEGILRHYCECRSGARTVGACSHLAAVI